MPFNKSLFFVSGVGRFTINFKSEIHDKTFKPGR